MKVISFYKYVDLDNPTSLRDEHFTLCSSLNLRGRIFIGNDGINGTASGEDSAIEKYKKALLSNPAFHDISFKEQAVSDHVFDKLIVRSRKKIVNFPFSVDLDYTGKKLSPFEFKQLMESNEDFVLIDARNTYETKIGKFHGAVDLGIETFREFPEKLSELEGFRNKKIVMYCTGGIRCEKASAFLKQQGFKDVSQLDGGILHYNEVIPNSYFEGECFVFDNRMSVPINTGEDVKIISFCEHCGKTTPRSIDCCNNTCNRIFVCCGDCEKRMNSGCSEYCSLNPTRKK